jgi:hypothetical protein
MLEVHYRQVERGVNLLLRPFEIATQFRPGGDLLFELLEGPGGAHDRISLTMDGTLRIAAGFRWRSKVILWGNRYTVRASLVHHAVYSLMRRGLIESKHRKAADCLFFTVLFQTDMPGVCVWLRYASVRLFGARLAARQRERGPLELWAP